MFALGSQVARPLLAGLKEHAFDIDTYASAQQLNAHLRALGSSNDPDQYRVLIVGAGLTGIELASELPARLSAIASSQGNSALRPEIILADASPMIGSSMGEEARAVILRALDQLGVQTRTSVSIASVDRHGVMLTDGERISTPTVVWCAGMRANELTKSLPGATDPLGRLSVDEFMRVQEVLNVFAAGDAARAVLDGVHESVMSCQHARPMGRYAGHNAAADLLGEPLLPLMIDWYVTVLDLGAWGAVCTSGWERRVTSIGQEAKVTKQSLSRHRIYPPLSGNHSEILAAAAPDVPTAPIAAEAPSKT